VDGVGAAARFMSPLGVALDAAGNLFVADSTSHTIRKIVVATGAVTTFAGAPGQSGGADGIGAAARFNVPTGVAADGSGNLFVADKSNRAIRKVVIASGAVTTLAVVAGLSGPCGIVSDGAGNLFIADVATDDGGNHVTIRKVVIASGAVTTLTTWQDMRYGGLYGMVGDGGGNLFVTVGNSIQKLAIATGRLTAFAGDAIESEATDGTGTAARFNSPAGIVGDGAGNLYVTDTGNYAIRRIVVATGEVTTLAGGGRLPDSVDGTGTDARLSAPNGLAFDGAGSLLFADAQSGSTIRKLAIASRAVTTLAGAATHRGSDDGVGAAARFIYPEAAASDGANLFVADTYNRTIRKIVIATGAVTTLAGTAGQYGIDDGIGAAARFSLPSSVAADGAGNLFVTDGIIRKIVIATGEVSTLTLGPGHEVSAPSPTGIASDGAGNVYFVNSGTAIWRVVIATGALTKIAGTEGQYGSADGTGPDANFRNPAALASDRAGNLYVADTYNATVRKVVLATRAVTTLAGTPGLIGTADGTGAAARFGAPAGIACDGQGNVYVADGNLVRKIAAGTANVSTLIGAPERYGVSLGALPASLSSASGLAVLPTGELAVIDAGENAVLIAR
jgi:sugar lactone lactonase YvrE